MGRPCIGDDLNEKAIRYVARQISLISGTYKIRKENIKRLLARIARGGTCGIKREELQAKVSNLELGEGFDDIINHLYDRRLIGITPDGRVCLDRKAYFYLGR